MIRRFALILIIILASSCRNERSTEPGSATTNIKPSSETSRDTISDLLKVENPRRDQIITSPLQITGKARGYWFFEAEATAELLDNNMKRIAESNTTATGEWMTEEWVPFSGTMAFEKPSTENGFLVLHKANASGLEEHAMSDTIPVRFRR